MRLSRLLLSLILLAALPAHADTYRVDLIVFLDKTDASELGRAATAPEALKTLDPVNGATLKSVGIEVLPDDQFALTDQWQRLKTSKRYQPLIRLAWLQQDPPSERGAALRLKWGEGISISNGEGRGASLLNPVDGNVTLLLGNYLNLDLDLVYTQRGADGVPASWRLREKRRVKRDEVHHIDSARLGVIARVSKIVPAKN